MTLLDIAFINQIFAGVLTFLAIGLLRFFYIVNDAIKMVKKDLEILSNDIREMKKVDNLQSEKINLSEKDILVLQSDFKHIIQLLNDIKNEIKKSNSR
jgi:hypothetical protein